MTTLCPFLYPFRSSEIRTAERFARKYLQTSICNRRFVSTATAFLDRLNPGPDDYSINPFVDKCALTIEAGTGGNGCISFLREKYVPNGPPNGGDGGFGGNIFIQAVKNSTSLNNISKSRDYVAGNGGHGQGGSQGGKKGKDVLLEVPVGTVIREIKRWDPIIIAKELERHARDPKSKDHEEAQLQLANKWLLYPGLTPRQRDDFDRFPPVPKARKPALATMEPPAPFRLDLDQPMDVPMLLAAGAMGGFGNPHFVSREHNRPQVATKGDPGMKIAMALELKLVADIGLVGLPNAGKSTLLRAMSNSRARIGNWAFTTLQPNIGTVMLDDYKGRSTLVSQTTRMKLGGRTRFSIADIPGIIEDAHLNRGLGLEFLRHIERAKILAFVIDLSAGDAIAALKALWREVGEYQTLKEQEEIQLSQKRKINPKDPFVRVEEIKPRNEEFEAVTREELESLPPISLPPITSKPWFVVATKAELPETQTNFLALQSYVNELIGGNLDHPSGKTNAHRAGATAIPISAIQGEGVDRIVDVVLDLLHE